jgi:transposase
LVYNIDYGSNDPNEPIKVICAPKMEAIYPDTAGTPVCYHCGSVISRLQQYKNRSIDDFPIQGRRTILEVLYATRYCVDCKKTYSPKLLCAEDRARLTNRHAAAITESAFEKKTFSQTAYDMHVSVALVESLFRAETKRREQNIFYEAHEHIGIDETKVHTKDKQKRMCIVIMQTDRDTVQKPSQKMSSLIALEQSRLDTASVIELLDRLDRPEIVKTVSMDMSTAYRNAVQIVLPDARIIVDRFHLVKSLNDKVRKVASSLYDKIKAELESVANTKVDTSFIDDDLPFELEEKEREVIAGNIHKSEPQSDAANDAANKKRSLF